ncbi:unnamed protein product [Caenorhabditis angaria]|uniref:RING-type domain-containing protein n=1 Tax=Caenorhabditis angaria TaxID=860376 RepID=A0A9P1J2U8_9PELO|nr:unnamed protein product [Caenorhabditis angaria]
MPDEDTDNEQRSFTPPPMLEREDWQDEEEENGGNNNADNQEEAGELEEEGVVRNHENGTNGYHNHPVLNGHLNDIQEIEEEASEESQDGQNIQSSSEENTVAYADSDRFSSDYDDYTYRPTQREIEDKENEDRARRNMPPVSNMRYSYEDDDDDDIDYEEDSEEEDDSSDCSDIVYQENYEPQFIDHLPEDLRKQLLGDNPGKPSPMDSDYYLRHGKMPPQPSTSTSHIHQHIKDNAKLRKRNPKLDISRKEWLSADPFMFDDIYRCFVCHDIAQWNLVLTCDHIFCGGCLTGQEEKCPKCEAPILSARHDRVIEKLLPRLKLDLLRKQPYCPKPENPFAARNLPRYAKAEKQSEEQSECSTSRKPEPLQNYSLPHVELVRMYEEDLDENSFNYRETQKRSRLSKKTVNSSFDHRMILDFSKMGCPVILRPRNIGVKVHRRTMHLILPETAYVGHLEEYVRRSIRDQLPKNGDSMVEISFRRIKYSRLRKDIRVTYTRTGKTKPVGRYKEPMLVYCQNINEPRLHNRWTLNEYRVHFKISQTSPIELTYDIKPLPEFQHLIV